MDILIAGFGVVGQGVAEVLAAKSKRLESDLGESIRIIGAFDSISIAFSKEGLDPLELVRTKSSTGTLLSMRATREE